jgi:HSP20 family protein
MYLTAFDPFAGDFRRLTRAALAYGPRFTGALPVDGVRRENDVLLRFDVPGIDPESIEVTVDKNVLTVTAKRNEEHTENDKFFVRERVTGTVTRRIALSENLNSDAVEASYENGVLEVTVPFAEVAQPRKIEVRKAAGELVA